MLDLKTLLKHALDDSDYEQLGMAVVRAYEACDDLMESNAVLSNFAVGMEKRSHLISPFVEHELSKLDGFFYEIKPNAARNCLHTRVHKNGLTITAHFLGRSETPRTLPKSALNRAVLAERNLSLFDDLEEIYSEPLGQGYCWLLHHGVIKPKFAALAIPNANQDTIIACTELPLPVTTLTEIEQVREEMVIHLLSEHSDEDAKTG